MTERRMLRTLLVAALLLPALAGQAAAKDGEPEAWSSEPRRVQATSDAQGFTLTSVRDTALARDLLEATYRAPDATLHLAFTPERPAGPSLSLDVTVVAVTEFRDADGDGSYSLGDPVVRRVPLAAQPAVPSVEATPDGWRATATHTVPAPAVDEGLLPGSAPTAAAPGRFTVAVDAAANPSPQRDPTAFRLSFQLDDYPASNGTHVAFEVAVASTSPPDQASVAGLSLAGGAHEVDLAWGDAPSSLTDRLDGTRFLYTPSFRLGSEARQDGTWSASWTPSGSGGMPQLVKGDTFLFAAGAVACLGLVAFPAWLRLRSSR